MRGSAEMLFHFGGHRTASKVRTIGAVEAISRVRTLGILPVDRQLDLLIDLRNGVAHSTGGDKAKFLLATLAKAIEALQEDLGGSLKSFWGRWSNTARIAVDHQRDRTEREVQVRIGLARHRFEDRFAGLPQDVLEQAQAPLKTRRRGWFPAGIHKETGEPGPLMGWFACPACANNALVILELVDNQGGVATDIFQCMLCGLRLEGPERVQGCPDQRAWAAGGRCVSLEPQGPCHDVVWLCGRAGPRSPHSYRRSGGLWSSHARLTQVSRTGRGGGGRTVTRRLPALHMDHMEGQKALHCTTDQKVAGSNPAECTPTRDPVE